MGWSDKLHLRMECGPTDEVIKFIRQGRPDLYARGVHGLCNEGQIHYGVMIRWRDQGWALLIRCHPHWYVQPLSDAVGRELIHTDDPKSTRSYLAARLLDGPAKPFAAGKTPPFEVASFISQQVPRGEFRRPHGPE